MGFDSSTHGCGGAANSWGGGGLALGLNLRHSAGKRQFPGSCVRPLVYVQCMTVRARTAAQLLHFVLEESCTCTCQCTLNSLPARKASLVPREISERLPCDSKAVRNTWLDTEEWLVRDYEFLREGAVETDQSGYKEVLSLYVRASQVQTNEFYERYHMLLLIKGLGGVWTSLTLLVAVTLVILSKCGKCRKKSIWCCARKGFWMGRLLCCCWSDNELANGVFDTGEGSARVRGHNRSAGN